MQVFFRLAGAILLVCSLLLGSVTTHAASVLVVLSESSPIYLEFADVLRKELVRDAVTLEVVAITSDAPWQTGPTEHSLVVTVGSRAAEAAANRDIRVPLLYTLLPRSAVERINATRKEDKRNSAIYIDQPPARYIDLLRIALPEFDRVGLFAGPDSREAAMRLAYMARDRRMKAQIEPINNEHDIYPAIQRMFAEPGALLATADTAVFNSQTIPSILLSAYRRRVPVVGFSQSYVKAGAVVALYSTPSQIAQQAAEIVRQALAGQGLPSAQYPRYFQVGVNARVAKSLDLQIDTETAIRERLERLERQP